MDNTVVFHLKQQSWWAMVKMGFLPNVFALNMLSMQRQPNTQTHTLTHILTFALTHTRDLWINSQALVWQGNTGNFRQLPLPACQTRGSRSVLVVCSYFCLLYFTLPESINAALQEEFWLNQCPLLDFTLTILVRAPDETCGSPVLLKGWGGLSVDMMSQGFCLKEETATV